MKRYLLPDEGQFYKANLHSHSTFSDRQGLHACTNAYFTDEWL